MKRLVLLVISTALLLALVACAQPVYVTTTDYQVATVTLPVTQYVTSTAVSTVTSPPLTNTTTATMTVTPPPVTTTYTVTAPPVTTTVTSTVTPTTTTPPTPVGTLVAHFTDTGSKPTGVFSISPASGGWWVYYSAKLADSSNPAMTFTFSVWQYPQGNQYIRQQTTQQPESSNVFIMGQSGMFFIDVVGVNVTWTLDVYQI